MSTKHKRTHRHASARAASLGQPRPPFPGLPPAPRARGARARAGPGRAPQAKPLASPGRASLHERPGLNPPGGRPERDPASPPCRQPPRQPEAGRRSAGAWAEYAPHAAAEPSVRRLGIRGPPWTLGARYLIRAAHPAARPGRPRPPTAAGGGSIITPHPIITIHNTRSHMFDVPPPPRPRPRAEVRESKARPTADVRRPPSAPQVGGRPPGPGERESR